MPSQLLTHISEHPSTAANNSVLDLTVLAWPAALGTLPVGKALGMYANPALGEAAKLGVLGIRKSESRSRDRLERVRWFGIGVCGCPQRSGLEGPFGNLPGLSETVMV